MTENKHIGKIIYALIALALTAVFLISAAAKGLLGLDKTALGAKIAKAASDTGIGQEYESELFDTDSVMTVDIIMSDDEWQELLDNAINEQYSPCDIVINGETFYNVGIRAKGNTSLTNIVNDDTTDRYSFKIKFDEYVTGQTCHGLDKLVLNNNYADATNMKEAIVYDMYAYLDADASLYNYSKISVNGEYIGVYIALEGVEDSFMLRNYGTKNGELYKPENMDFGDGPSDKRRDPPKLEQDGFNPENMPEGFDPEKMPEGFDPEKMQNKEKFPDRGGFGGGGGSNLEYTDDDLDSYSTIWNGAVTDSSNKDHKRVVKALKAISEGDLSSIEEYMDVDNLLKYMAVHEFAVNGDSLSGNMAHNYYLYESEGQLNIIPWDYNLSWGGIAGGGHPQSGEDPAEPRATIDEVDSDGRASFKTADATSVINDPIDDSWESTNFFDILLENEEYNAKYHEYLQMLVDYVENGEYEKVTNRIHSQIDELVKTDPTAFYTYDEYEAATTMLDEVIHLRAESIKGQLDGTIPDTSEGQKADSSTLVDGTGIDTSVMGRMNGGGGPGDNKGRPGMGENKE
ncbi:MAG: CotH kinase family protein [Lachnospiraceae bacterium]|nr:CotH kinase family protein [Lachnospiraceae bacterium]